MSLRSWIREKTGFDYKDPNDYAVAPVTGLYWLGAGINKATGGGVAEWNPFRANDPGGSAGTTYSKTTQVLSGYDGAAPGTGDWTAPLLGVPALEAGRWWQEEKEDFAALGKWTVAALAALAVLAVRK